LPDDGQALRQLRQVEVNSQPASPINTPRPLLILTPQEDSLTIPCIVTTIHNPIALIATCRRLSMPPPQHGTIQLDDREVTGWIIYLIGVRYPIVCDTLTGLIAYHPRDNLFSPYARIMRFIHRYYEVHAQLHHVTQHPAAQKPVDRAARQRALAI
jgi:hypothetical protein